MIVFRLWKIVPWSDKWRKGLITHCYGFKCLAKREPVARQFIFYGESIYVYFFLEISLQSYNYIFLIKLGIKLVFLLNYLIVNIHQTSNISSLYNNFTSHYILSVWSQIQCYIYFKQTYGLRSWTNINLSIWMARLQQKVYIKLIVMTVYSVSGFQRNVTGRRKRFPMNNSKNKFRC